MKKSFLILFCAVFLPIHYSFGWYAGLSLGQSIADGDVNMNTEESTGTGIKTWNDDADIDHTNFPSLSAFIGKEIKSTPHGNFFLEFDGKYTTEKSQSTSNSSFADAKVHVERPLVFGMNAGFSRPITPDTSVFVRLGLVGSQFNTRISDSRSSQIYSSSDSQFKWGLVPSIGIQKDIAGFTMGLVYSYYIYQDLMVKGTNLSDRIAFTNTITPRYHLIEARVSKKL